MTGKRNLNLIKGNRAELSKFGFLVGVIFAVIGLLPVLKGKPLNIYLLLLGVLLIIAGAIAPMSLSPLYSIWMKAGHVLGKINSYIILSIIFYFVFTPMRLLIRIFSKERKFDFRSGKTSYWIRRGQENYKETMRRQF